jgi:hypothetical protein
MNSAQTAGKMKSMLHAHFQRAAENPASFTCLRPLSGWWRKRTISREQQQRKAGINRRKSGFFAA